jgi:hypothetical protein
MDKIWVVAGFNLGRANCCFLQAAVQNDSASERIVNGTIRQQEKKRSAEVGACGGG